MSSKNSNAGTTNRCERCNRPLKDPNAEYGWRCAEILGITTDLNRSGDGAFDSYNAGVSEAMHYLRENNINQDSIDTKAFIEANIKRRIAEDLEDYRLYELAVEEMNNALKPAMMRMFNGETKTPTIPELLNRLDDHHYLNGSYTTKKYHDGSYSKEIYELQRMLNANGVRGRYWDKLSEDGILGAETLRAYDLYRTVAFNSIDVDSTKLDAKNRLIDTIRDQYFWENRAIDATHLIPGVGVMVNNEEKKRLEDAFDIIDENISTIIEAEKTFGVPREVVGSIILKEIYTQSLSDLDANVTTSLGNRFPQLKNMTFGINVFGEHSTGPGAIFPNTAKNAWNTISELNEISLSEEYHNLLNEVNQDNQQIQLLLASDDAFNITTIGAVVYSKAHELGYSKDELMTLDIEDWKKILTLYNGDTEYG